MSIYISKEIEGIVDLEDDNNIIKQHFLSFSGNKALIHPASYTFKKNCLLIVATISFDCFEEIYHSTLIEYFLNDMMIGTIIKDSIRIRKKENRHKIKFKVIMQ